jgi:hypothetical protein
MTLTDLHRLTVAVNEAARRETGHRANCILASGALMDILHTRGVEARCVRAEVVATPRSNARIGHALGSFGDGTRRPAAGPGMWHGHLVVVAGDVLLDPTLDNLAHNEDCAYLKPFAGPITDTPRSARGGMWFTLDHAGIGTPIPTWLGSDVRYNLYPDVGGWKSTGMFRKRIRARLAARAMA